jgi:hypothetical protein
MVDLLDIVEKLNHACPSHSSPPIIPQSKG